MNPTTINMHLSLFNFLYYREFEIYSLLNLLCLQTLTSSSLVRIVLLLMVILSMLLYFIIIKFDSMAVNAYIAINADSIIFTDEYILLDYG